MKVSYNIEEDLIRIRPILSEVDRLVCNNDKLMQNTLWKPKNNLQSAIHNYLIPGIKKLYNT